MGKILKPFIDPGNVFSSKICIIALFSVQPNYMALKQANPDFRQALDMKDIAGRMHMHNLKQVLCFKPDFNSNTHEHLPFISSFNCFTLVTCSEHILQLWWQTHRCYSVCLFYLWYGCWLCSGYDQFRPPQPGCAGPASCLMSNVNMMRCTRTTLTENQFTTKWGFCQSQIQR